MARKIPTWLGHLEDSVLYEGITAHGMWILEHNFLGNEPDELHEDVEAADAHKAKYGVYPDDDPELEEHLRQQWQEAVLKDEHPYGYTRPEIIAEIQEAAADLLQCAVVVNQRSCCLPLGHTKPHMAQQ